MGMGRLGPRVLHQPEHQRRAVLEAVPCVLHYSVRAVRRRCALSLGGAARTGGILAFVAVYRLGNELKGPWSGALAVGALALTLDYADYALRGTSEPLLVCFTMWAIVVHMDGRRGLAFASGSRRR